MQLWPGPCLKALTRQRREEARRLPTIRYTPHTIAQERIDAYDQAAHLTVFYGFVATERDRTMWHFQCGHCYMCDALFTAERPATREHVKPRVRGD